MQAHADARIAERGRSDDEIRILHVDDDPDVAELTATFLERQRDEFSVVTETTAAAGLDRLADGTFHCVVSDHDMPGTDGLEFFQAVREHHPDLPFILFTGKGSEEIASEAIGAGVTDYVLKRTGSDQYVVLANRIRNAVSNYRTERIIRRLQSRRTALFENAPDPMVEVVTDGDVPRIRAVNAAFERTFGGDGDTLVGRSALDATISDESETVRERVSERLASGERVDAAVTAATADGEREFRLQAIPIDPDGGTDGAFGWFTDITERKRRERTLRQSRERYRTLVDESPHPIYVVQDGEIVYTNDALVDLLGADDRSALLGSDPTEFVHPDTEPAAVERLRRVESGESLDRREGRLVTVDDATRHVEAVATPITWRNEPAGQVLYVDITDRKRRERELRESRERFRKLFAESNDAIMIVDIEAEAFLEANPAACEMLGYDYEELLAMHPADIHPNDIDTVREEFISQVLTEGSGWTDELTCLTKNGTEIPTEISAAVLSPDDGAEEPTRMVGILRDVSDRRAYRAELEQQNERLEEFVGVVSHDLRSPLDVLSSSLALARETGDPEDFERCRRSIDRMRQLIDDLLDLARTGNAVDEIEPVSVAAVAEAARESVETAGVTVRIGPDATVAADRSRLRQLLENLLRNAVEHGGETVTVGAEPPGDEAAPGSKGGFYVDDDGPGIPDADREAVFEVGYTTDDGGTGFGLSIVERIAEAHGWDVRVTESDAGGARFEVTGVERPGE